MAGTINKTPLENAYARYKAVLLTTFVFSFVINLLLFVGPLYMLQIYDRILSSRSELTLLMVSLITLFLLTVYGTMEFIRSRMLVRAGKQFDAVLSEAIFKRAVKAKLASPNGGAEFIVSDGDRIREFLTGQGMMAFFDVPWVPLFVFVCFLFHPWLGAMAASGTLIILALALVNEFATRGELRSANNASQDASHFAGAALQNAEVIRAMGMEDRLSRRWREHHDKMVDFQAGASDKAGVISTVQKFVRMTLQSGILGLGAYLALHQQITPGIMIAASIMMGRVLQPVEQTVAQWKHFVAARQAHGRLAHLFGMAADIDERVELPKPEGLITVEQLTSLAPGSKKPFLKGLNFSVQPGEIVSVIGPSGAGKSSLIRHLVGVWPAANGTVRIDGADIRHWTAEQLGAHLGYLPQEVRLFSGTIAENISRFSSGSTHQIVRAAIKAGVHEMILRLPNGYETPVGENGQQLSGGQRQRVGLARALFGEPRIVVLDEPNANLDNAGEASLTQAIKWLRKEGVTVVVVSHKTSLLAASDKVLILREGMTQAMTTPQEVLRSLSEPVRRRAANAPPQGMLKRA